MRRAALFLTLAALNAGVVLALDGARELDVARQALRDGLWDIAEKHAMMAAEDPALRVECELLALEALSRADKYDEIIERLRGKDLSGEEGFRYWRAWAHYKKKDFAAAKDDLAKPFQSKVYIELSERLSARIALAERDRKAAESHFSKVAEIASDIAVKTANAIEWAQALVGLDDKDAALVVLDKSGAAQAGTPEGDEACLMMASILKSRNEVLKAVPYWETLLNAGDRVTSGAYVAAAVELSNCYAAEGRTNDAVKVASTACDRAGTSEEKSAAQLALGFLQVADKDTRAQGMKAIKDVVRANPDAPQSKTAQMRLAEMLLALGDDGAADEYRIVLETFPETARDSSVLAGRALALLRGGHYTEAAGFFDRAAKTATNENERAHCEFKRADALSQGGLHEEAAAAYYALSVSRQNSPLAAKALFNCAAEYETAADTNKAYDAYSKLVQFVAKAEDQESAFLRSSAFLRLSAIDTAQGRIEGAIMNCTRVIEDPLSPAELVTAAYISRGQVRYRSYRFDDALSDFTMAASNDTSRVSAMQFMTALCDYGQGRDAAARDGMRRLKNDLSTDSPLLPEVTLWMAKYDFNRGDYVSAERGFREYLAFAVEGDRAAQAYVWAAKAAFANADYAAAVELVTAAIKNYPNCAAIPEGMVVQGSALMELARFAEAAIVLDRARLSDPEGVSAQKAALLRADALLALGADDDSRYEDAIKAYREVLAGTKVSPSERIAVAYKIGKALEKTGEMNEAMDQYYTQVVISYRDQRLAGTWFDEAGKTFFARAAFTLADRFEARGQFDQAIQVLKLVRNAGVSASEEAARRIDAITDKRSLL